MDVTRTDGFTVAKVDGGWQIYDVRHRRHVGRVWRSQVKAQSMIDRVHAENREPIARFILTGSTS